MAILSTTLWSLSSEEKSRIREVLVSYETIISNQQVAISNANLTIEAQDIYITNLKAIVNEQADTARRNRVKHIVIGASIGAGVMILLKLIF